MIEHPSIDFSKNEDGKCRFLDVCSHFEEPWFIKMPAGNWRVHLIADRIEPESGGSAQSQDER